MTKNKLRKQIDTLFKPKAMHRQHYLKWDIDGDWSIRYFWLMDSRPKLEGKWVLKSHKEKIYVVLSHSEALDYIMYRATSAKPKEIHGILVRGGYRKLEVSHG